MKNEQPDRGPVGAGGKGKMTKHMLQEKPR